MTHCAFDLLCNCVHTCCRRHSLVIALRGHCRNQTCERFWLRDASSLRCVKCNKNGANACHMTQMGHFFLLRFANLESAEFPGMESFIFLTVCQRTGPDAEDTLIRVKRGPRCGISTCSQSLCLQFFSVCIHTFLKGPPNKKHSSATSLGKSVGSRV